MKSVLHYSEYLLFEFRALIALCLHRHRYTRVCVCVCVSRRTHCLLMRACMYVCEFVWACVPESESNEFVICSNVVRNRTQCIRSSGDDDSSCSIANKQPSKRCYVQRVKRQKQQQHQPKQRMSGSKTTRKSNNNNNSSSSGSNKMARHSTAHSSVRVHVCAYVLKSFFIHPVPFHSVSSVRLWAVQ